MVYALLLNNGNLEQVQILSEDHPELPAGTIINSTCRFWPGYQKWLTDGNTPIPVQPSPYHILNNNNEWIEDFERWIDMGVRAKRDAKLSACDYKIMPDYPIEPTKKTELESYRQALRDLPGQLSQVTDPIPWPTEPAP